MAFVEPVNLEQRGVRLVPLALEHEQGLRTAAADGELWRLRITSVPEPEQTRDYIVTALAQREAGQRFAFAVTDAATGTVLGSSSYHDILPAVKRAAAHTTDQRVHQAVAAIEHWCGGDDSVDLHAAARAARAAVHAADSARAAAFAASSSALRMFG